MCTVSAVFEYGRNMPYQQWTVPAIDEFRKLVEAAEDFDAVAGEPDCVDPAKAEWLGLVEELVALKETKDVIEGRIEEILIELGEMA